MPTDNTVPGAEDENKRTLEVEVVDYGGKYDTRDARLLYTLEGLEVPLGDIERLETLARANLRSVIDQLRWLIINAYAELTIHQAIADAFTRRPTPARSEPDHTEAAADQSIQAT